MKVETFAQLVEAIQRLPVSHRKTALALECNSVAQSFRDLATDVHAAGKTAKPTPPKRIKCRS